MFITCAEYIAPLDLEAMRRSAAILFAWLALTWATAPLLACVLPMRAMTAQESECCKRMTQMCGSPNMPQSHSCCKKEVRATDAIVVKKHQEAVPVLAVVTALPVPNSPRVIEFLPVSTQHQPPGEILAESTVLRI